MNSPLSNATHLWSALIVEELVRSGVTHFFLAPGSRSTPLVTAVAANKRAEHTMHFDERGTAYAALGYGRATGQPAAWITTSGTAVANGMPAVVEAAADSVPMILLTADRPPELRQTGANQTIDQVKFFGGYVRWYFELPVPASEIEPTVVLTTVDQAVYRALRSPAGPVHLNCMFREPLEPGDDPIDLESELMESTNWPASFESYTRYSLPAAIPDPSIIFELQKLTDGTKRGLIVVGKLNSIAEAKAVSLLAETLNWPLLPDIRSQLRLAGAKVKCVIPYYDQLLASERFQNRHRPDVVFHFGDRPTSKRLQQFLVLHRPEHYIKIQNTPYRLDPTHQVSRVIEADIETFCQALVRIIPLKEDKKRTWLADWRFASDWTEQQLHDFFSKAETLSEPQVARDITRFVPAAHGLCLASSMPVRDVDRFSVADRPDIHVIANRGASGIDGTIGTAAGFALGREGPVTLVIGDLALLHDLNSLALIRGSRYPVFVVVFNNNGGGIFSFLPIARRTGVFEQYFGTPHGLTFHPAAELFGLPYFQPANPAEFRSIYHGSVAEKNTSVLIEINTDRKENVELHRQLDDMIKDNLP